MRNTKTKHTATLPGRGRALALAGGLALALSGTALADTGTAELAPAAQSMTATAAEAGPSRALTLEESVALALRNNLDLQVQGYGRQRVEAAVGQQEAAFAPTLGASLEYLHDRFPPRFRILGTDNRQLAGKVSLSQRLPWGTEYELSFGMDSLDTDASVVPFNPSTAAQLLLRVRQPLLRGLIGGPQQTAVELARWDARIADAGFRRAAEETVYTTVQAYWRLVRAHEAREVAREALQLAAQLRSEIALRVELGTLSPVELTQAAAGVAARQEGIIRAEAEVGDAGDGLARVLAAEGTSAFGLGIVPTQRPVLTPSQVTLENRLEGALQQRSDLQSLREGVKSAETALRFAGNQLLPDVSAVGSVGVGGLDAQAGAAVGQLATALDRQSRWSAGLVFSYPLGNRGPFLAHERARLALRQAQAALRSQELRVEEEVRGAVRAVNANAQRVASMRHAVQLAREQLAAEEKRLASGHSTSFQVLRLQTDLTQVRHDEVSAVTDYVTSLSQLDRATGTLLARFGAGDGNASTSEP